jgi:hypothetical protein
MYRNGELICDTEPEAFWPHALLGSTSVPATLQGLMRGVNSSGAADIVAVISITQQDVGLNPVDFDSSITDVNRSDGWDTVDALSVT